MSEFRQDATKAAAIEEDNMPGSSNNPIVSQFKSGPHEFLYYIETILSEQRFQDETHLMNLFNTLHTLLLQAVQGKRPDVHTIFQTTKEITEYIDNMIKKKPIDESYNVRQIINNDTITDYRIVINDLLKYALIKMKEDNKILQDNEQTQEEPAVAAEAVDETEQEKFDFDSFNLSDESIENLLTDLDSPKPNKQKLTGGKKKKRTKRQRKNSIKRNKSKKSRKKSHTKHRKIRR